MTPRHSGLGGRWRALLRALLRALPRAPILHFLALGGSLLALEAAFEEPEPLRVSAVQVRMLEDEQRRQLGRPPSAKELEGVVEAWISDELAVREARRLGFHRSDLVIQRRLIDKMEVLGDGAGDVETGLLLERAFALGLDRSDPIVRRRLVQLVEQGWARRDGPLRASPEALEDFLVHHAERFGLPPRVELSHVFVAGTGGAVEPRAQALLDQFREVLMEPDDAVAWSDAFPRGLHLKGQGEEKLARTLGASAARLAFEAPVGEWVGPVASVWGQHLLFVHRRIDPELPGVEVLRPQLLQAMADEREKELLEIARRALRQRSRIVVEEPGG